MILIVCKNCITTFWHPPKEYQWLSRSKMDNEINQCMPHIKQNFIEVRTYYCILWNIKTFVNSSFELFTLQCATTMGGSANHFSNVHPPISTVSQRLLQIATRYNAMLQKRTRMCCGWSKQLKFHKIPSSSCPPIVYLSGLALCYTRV